MKSNALWAALIFAATFFTTGFNHAHAAGEGDIRPLSQHFIDPENYDPWIFLPKDNIKEISTRENPGYLTIRQAGKGKDVKGLLKEPIKLSDYPMPWQFHMGILQNYLGVKGLVDGQINWAYGLNIAVTFSDPSTWPADRSQRPPDTHDLQLFVVHLGNQGENYRQGIPAVKHTDLNQWDYSPEVYLVYGRGDLAPNLNGDWKYNYTWVGPEPSLSGTWKRFGGPSEYSIRFNVSMDGPGSMQVGVGSGHDSGWRYRAVDLSRFGKPATGIWEIGPVISLDNWISDTLASELNLNKPPMWLDSFVGHHKVLNDITTEGIKTIERVKDTFKVQPPDPQFEYFVDYCVFFGNGPKNIEHLSEDFNVPGFLADQKYYIEGNAFGETYSNPGYMTLTSYGTNGGWAICPILNNTGTIDLSGDRKPPFEIELAVKPPETDRMWNLWWNVGLFDSEGKMHSWQPCVRSVPGKGVKFGNSGPFQPDVTDFTNPSIDVDPVFEPEVPQSVIGQPTLYMLIQIPDEYTLRVGFKANKDDPWTMSKPYNTKDKFGKIAQFSYPALVSFYGDHVGGHGWGVGNYPNYHRFLIDYLYYRYTLSR